MGGAVSGEQWWAVQLLWEGQGQCLGLLWHQERTAGHCRIALHPTDNLLQRRSPGVTACFFCLGTGSTMASVQTTAKPTQFYTFLKPASQLVVPSFMW